jgi:hypothetical protein
MLTPPAALSVCTQLTFSQNEEGGGDETENAEIHLPNDLPWLGHAFPFATAAESRLQVRQWLLSSLPDAETASRLSKIYYKHCAWMWVPSSIRLYICRRERLNTRHRYTPIPETDFYSTVYSRIYDQGIGLDQDPSDSHRLAVLFMVFALGTLFDLDMPYLAIETTQYYQLARASLSLDSVLESQSIPAIQALVSLSAVSLACPVSTEACSLHVFSFLCANSCLCLSETVLAGL